MKKASSKKYTQFKTRVQKPCSTYDQNRQNQWPTLLPNRLKKPALCSLRTGSRCLLTGYAGMCGPKGCD